MTGYLPGTNRFTAPTVITTQASITLITIQEVTITLGISTHTVTMTHTTDTLPRTSIIDTGIHWSWVKNFDLHNLAVIS
jgi:hypothetical protein